MIVYRRIEYRNTNSCKPNVARSKNNEQNEAISQDIEIVRYRAPAVGNPTAGVLDQSNCPQIIGGRFAGPPIGHDLEFDLLALVQAMHSSALDCADMHEDVLAAVIRLNEAEALLTIEPLHGSL
jgi:hypothetical protein